MSDESSLTIFKLSSILDAVTDLGITEFPRATSMRQQMETWSW